METLQPTLRLGRDVWDRDAMPPEEFHRRAERLRAAMTVAGLDALLLYGSGLNASGHPTYISNYAAKLPLAALVILPQTADPVLIFQGTPRGRAAAQATTWIDDVRPCWDIAGTCVTALGDRGLTRGRLGMAGIPRLLPYGEWNTLRTALDRATFVDADAIVHAERAIKSAREVAQIRRAARITEDACRSVEDSELPGSSEASLAARLMRAARVKGAEDLRLMVARPAEADWAFRPSEDVSIGDGEIVFVLLRASWERYWAEAVRTYRLRSGRLEVVWPEDLDARFRRVVAEARPGVSVTDFTRTVERSLTSAELDVLTRYGLGNGVGVDPVEAPFIPNPSGKTVERGMCLAIRMALAAGIELVMRGDTFALEP